MILFALGLQCVINLNYTLFIIISIVDSPIKMNTAFVFIASLVLVSLVRISGYTANLLPKIANLTPGQWGSIHRILSHPETPLEIVKKTRKVIYLHYESWAIHRAHVFRKSRLGICRHISADELAVYASRGLIRAIEGCDFANFPDTLFSAYAAKWVDYELLDGMTTLQSITTLPKRFHKRKGVQNRRHFRVRTIENREFYVKNRNLEEEDGYARNRAFENAWEEIDSVITDPFAKRVFRLKYSATLDQVRSNAEIAELMTCCEETVRKTVLGGRFKDLRSPHEVVNPQFSEETKSRTKIENLRRP